MGKKLIIVCCFLIALTSSVSYATTNGPGNIRQCVRIEDGAAVSWFIGSLYKTKLDPGLVARVELDFHLGNETTPADYKYFSDHCASTIVGYKVTGTYSVIIKGKDTVDAKLTGVLDATNPSFVKVSLPHEEPAAVVSSVSKAAIGKRVVNKDGSPVTVCVAVKDKTGQRTWFKSELHKSTDAKFAGTVVVVSNFGIEDAEHPADYYKGECQGLKLESGRFVKDDRIKLGYYVVSAGNNQPPALFRGELTEEDRWVNITGN